MKNRLIGVKEAFNLPILLVVVPTVILGFILGGAANIFHLVDAIVLVFLLSVGANVLNNYADWEIDIMNKKRDAMHKAWLRNELLMLYLAILLIIFAIAYFSGLNIYLYIVLIMLTLLGMFYSIVVRFKDVMPLNYLTIAGAYGILVFYVGFFAAPFSLSRFWMWLPIPLFLFVMDLGYSITKDYSDMLGDKAYDKKTLPLVIGKAASVKVQAAIISCAYVFLLLLILFNRLNYLFSFLFLSYLLAFYILWRTRSDDNKTLRKMHFFAQLNGLFARFIIILIFLFVLMSV